MAVLSNGARAMVWAEFMRRQTEPFGVTKADIRAGVDALDEFLNANAAAINSAIPQPARSGLSASQKALLLQYVIERRYGEGS